MRSQTIVITGSTRGIGRGLAKEFLARGCRVVISSRSQEAVDKTIAELGAGDRVTGLAADVSRRSDLQALWDHSIATFGRVDIWINNAGISLPRHMIWETPEDSVQNITSINLIGAINGCAVAIAGMLAQGSGYVWNMEGYGSNGMKAPGMAPYGSTKYGLTYLTGTVVKELADKPVGIGYLSPGIVVTDLLVGDYDGNPAAFEKAKRALAVLGDKVETVTPFLADGVLNTHKNGARVAWLTKRKAALRFATAGKQRKRNIFEG
jgi:NAD(P)-dependent dehydrogenase (short-subunit alcohol dehydrogenase family)